jgi:hypothetical protein
MQQHHVGVLGMDEVELCPDQLMIVEVETAREGNLGAGRQQHLGLAATKSRLSIIAAVRVRWLTIDPARGRQAEPVWRS